MALSLTWRKDNFTLLYLFKERLKTANLKKDKENDEETKEMSQSTDNRAIPEAQPLLFNNQQLKPHSESHIESHDSSELRSEESQYNAPDCQMPSQTELCNKSQMKSPKLYHANLNEPSANLNESHTTTMEPESATEEGAEIEQAAEGSSSKIITSVSENPPFKSHIDCTNQDEVKETQNSVIIMDNASFSWDPNGRDFMLKDLSFSVEKGKGKNNIII